MKVLLISSFWPPKIGGIPSLLNSLIPHMTNRGVKFIVVTIEPNPSNFPGCEIIVSKTLSAARDLTQTYYEMEHSSWEEQMDAIAKTVQRLKSEVSPYKPDLVFSHTEKIVSGLLAESMGIPHVAVMHGIIPFKEELIAAGHSVVRYHDQIMKMTTQIHGIHVFVSNYAKNEWEKRGLISEKSEIVYNPIQIYHTKGELEKIREKLNIPPDAVVICSPQRPARMGFHMLAETMATIIEKEPNVYFLICGVHSKVELPDCLLKDNPLDQIRYGYFSQEEMAGVYSESDITVMPGRDTFGLPAYESLAYGTPVLAVRNSAVQEMLQDNENVHFFDGEAIDLQRKIECMISKNKNSHHKEILLTTSDMNKIAPDRIAEIYVGIMSRAVEESKECAVG